MAATLGVLRAGQEIGAMRCRSIVSDDRTNPARKRPGSLRAAAQIALRFVEALDRCSTSFLGTSSAGQRFSTRSAAHEDSSNRLYELGPERRPWYIRRHEHEVATPCPLYRPGAEHGHGHARGHPLQSRRRPGAAVAVRPLGSGRRWQRVRHIAKSQTRAPEQPHLLLSAAPFP
jgi:hypothetical protein